MNTPAKTQIRIGKIRYLNCLPFHFGLSELCREKGLEGALSFFESHPAAINEAMQKGEIDVAPVSAMEYLQHQSDYFLLSDLAIGARLFARSVLLLSMQKIETLNGAAIALSRESLSSITLARILLKRKYGFVNTFDAVDQDPEVMLKNYPAAIVIGDQALFCQPKDLVYKYDLGELWQQWTGLPFVFALWVVRRETVNRDPAAVKVLAEVLRENLLKNLADPEGFLKGALGIVPADRRFCQMLGYFVNLQYLLDENMKAGLKEFFALAHEEGLAPAPQPLENFPS